jgi:small-conductance mechanosensitive channel
MEREMKQVLGAEPIWLVFGGALLVAVLLGLVGHYVLFRVAERIARKPRTTVQASLLRHSRSPARVILSLIAILLVLPLVPVEPDYGEAIRHVIRVGTIASVAWLAIALTQVFEDVISARERTERWDDHTTRQVQTRVRLLRRVGLVLVGVVALAAILMTFSSVQHLGTSLLASAGIIGLVAGIAARPVLSNLIAGVQIALTQPIRIGDVVVVEGEWGKIEEIYTTYVVVKIWDLRRLVLPLSYFIERPFQNWTRRTDNLLATVFLYADYTVPVEVVRQELHRVLLASNLWDGTVWRLQVTKMTAQTVELRAMISATDSDNAWDLQCHVREKLIEFMQTHIPGSLPKTREVAQGSV